MSYISIDMEWNQPYSKQQLKTNNDVTLYGEIVQIGAVKMDDYFNITDTFKVTVIPTVYKKMNKRVSKMTGITDEVISSTGIDRQTAYESFFEWCGNDSTFLTWGNDDYDMMSKNLRFFGMCEDVPVCYNLQCIYNYDTHCYGRQYSLDHAMETFNIESELDRHDALNDAYFTALVCKKLRVKQGIDNYETVSEVSMQSEDFLMSFQYDGYLNPGQAMKEKSVVKRPCPYCNGRSKIVKRWKQGRHKYVILNKCRKHGFFISRIRFSKNVENLVTANKNIYKFDDTNREYFEEKFREWKVV